MSKLLFLCMAGLGGGILLWAFLVRERKQEQAAIKELEAEAPTADAAFLDAIGVVPGTEDARTALAVREMVAKAGEVTATAIRAEHRFYPDLGALPFYDSPDAVEFVLGLEEILGRKISDASAADMALIRDWGGLTVGQFALRVAAACRRSRQIQATGGG